MQLYSSDAPAKSYHLQHVLNTTYKDAVLAQLLEKTSDTLYKAHLMSLSNRGAMLWTSLDLRLPEHIMPDNSFNNSVRMALALQPSKVIAADPRAKCCCGFLLKLDPLHFYACPKFRKLAQNIRHEDVRIAIGLCSDRAGYVTHKEHIFPNGKRADISLLCPLSGSFTHGDVSVTLASAPSYCLAASRKSLSAAEARVHAKVTKYAELCRKEGAYFAPIIMETTGAMSKPALQLFSRIADLSAATNPHNPQSAARITQCVAIALHNGNAKIIQQGLSRSLQAYRPVAGPLP